MPGFQQLLQLSLLVGLVQLQLLFLLKLSCSWQKLVWTELKYAINEKLLDELQSKAVNCINKRFRVFKVNGSGNNH